MALNELKGADNAGAPAVGPQIFFRPIPTHVDAKALSAGTAETYTVPADAKYIVFSADGDFYALSGGTATVAIDTSDGSASELNPPGYIVEGGESISLIASANTVVTIAVYTKATPR